MVDDDDDDDDGWRIVGVDCFMRRLMAGGFTALTGRDLRFDRNG